VTNTDPPTGGLSRRRLLGVAALGGSTLAVAGAGAGYAAKSAASESTPSTAGPVPFYGTHQAGIATPAQDRLAFAAFDVVTEDSQQLQGMLGLWAAAAARMTRGELVGPTESAPQSPPVDTGEALGLNPGQLTVTVGFGPGLFDDRFGLAGKRPAALAPLPDLPGDQLDRSISGGDICVQACSEDPQVAFHVIRNFARMGRGTVVLKWSQLGFGRTSTTSVSQSTPRNLMGFKDGTNNIKAENAAEMADYVWVGDETDQPWMVDGSYLVSRRIRMSLESWDADYLADQQRVFGRFKDTGAPLTGHQEFDAVNLTAKTASGTPVIPLDAHIRLASHATNDGIRILRRGYSFTDGIDPRTGQFDAGLFFIAFQKNAHTQFVPLQTRLGTNDALNEYITHTSSALFAVPPGLHAVGDWFGRRLFQS
jgi:deferrochelatase/peroxidase EfeB